MHDSPILLTRRLKHKRADKSLILPLSSEERTKLRCRRKTLCGTEVLLQLPRVGPLMHGDLLAGEHSLPQVLEQAALEDLLEVTAKSELELCPSDALNII